MSFSFFLFVSLFCLSLSPFREITFRYLVCFILVSWLSVCGLQLFVYQRIIAWSSGYHCLSHCLSVTACLLSVCPSICLVFGCPSGCHCFFSFISIYLSIIVCLSDTKSFLILYKSLLNSLSFALARVFLFTLFLFLRLSKCFFFSLSL